MVSMKDIARECNVSVATVSKALNGHDDISKETRDRVHAMASSMGYYPNAAARALKTNRSYNIGVLFTDDAHSGLRHEHFSAVLDGFKVKAEKSGYDITFINSYVGNNHMTYLEHCRYRGIDGVVIACVDYEKPEVLELVNSDIPTVTIDYVFHNCTSVISNNVSGIEELLKYVIELGHTKIAYIHGQAKSAVTKDRVASFYNTLDLAEIEVNEDYIKTADYLDTIKAEEVTKELLKSKNAPTCILYPDDTALIGGLNAIRDLRLKIPEDISIAGYDGSRLAKLLNPKLTTIKQDTKKMGELAAKELIVAIENSKRAITKHIVVDGKLLKGSSVGTPKNI